MTDELKTLKDLPPQRTSTEGCYWCEQHIEIIKQEVIKWIKMCRKGITKENSESHYSQCGLAQASILIQFFNITEEDLK